jgi:hypothetical protein
VDESELQTLFRSAPGDPPPPRFTAGDVTAASARATVRRRTALSAAAACVVLVLTGFGVATVLRGGGEQQNASAPGVHTNSELSAKGQPGAAPGRPPNAATPQQGFPSTSPKQGGEGSGENGPRAESTSGCDKVDRELATALAGELPVTVLPQPSPGRVCTADSRAAGFEVRDGARSGLVSVTVLAPGVTMSFPPQPAGAVDLPQRSKSGGTVWVFSTPDTGTTEAPFASQLPRIAADLAARY